MKWLWLLGMAFLVGLTLDMAFGGVAHAGTGPCSWQGDLLFSSGAIAGFAVSLLIVALCIRGIYGLWRD